MQNSFKKNIGNAGLDGIQFQVNLLTMFLLNAVRGLNGWRISTENEAAGKFDDIVLELSDGSAILLQAKHKNNRKITKDQLLSDNSKNADFSLPKYFLSYQEIKSKFEVKNIIICTNADIDERKLKGVFSFQHTNADNILYYPGENSPYITFNENILYDLMVRSENYYENNLKGKGVDKNAISNENLKDFLEKLQFFTNYPSGGNLNKVIDFLLTRLSEWKLWDGISSQEIYGKVEEWFKDRRGEYLTETYANAMCCEIKSDKCCKALKSYGISFTDTDFYFGKEKRVFQISTERKNYLLQVLKTYCALKERITLYVDPQDGLEVYRTAVEVFGLPKYEYLVLILLDTTSEHLIKEMSVKLKQILDKYDYKKLVLIGSETLALDVLKFDERVTIESLTKDSRKKLVKKRAITFQGKDVSLEELLSPSKIEDNSKTINSDILEVIVKGEKIKVGTQPPNLGSSFLRYYVKRTFERETDNMGIDATSDRDLEETSYEAMNNGSRIELVTEENIFDVTEKVVLISDSAGTGKSTVLSKLAADIKEQHPHLWVIRITLNDYTRILRDSLKGTRDTVTIIELLNSNETTRLSNQLEDIVFSMNEKVVIMLDGLDEISPDYTRLILSMLSQCYEAANFAKIFVTTRPHMNRELERIFNVKPFELQPFTAQNQTAFLASYWVSDEADENDKIKCKRYSVTLLRKMSSWINKGNNFASIPLQLRMVAEIFEENSSIEWEGCKQFLLGNAEEPKLPDKMNITKLYEMFVEKKLDIFVDKANPSGSADVNRLYCSYFGKYITNHQSLALRVVFDTEKVGSLFSSYQYDKGVEPEILKIGIVQKTNENLGFVHRTFAEYFAAKSVLEISQLRQLTMNEDVHFQRFFVDEILCYPDFAVIRAFLESTIQDVVGLLPSNIFENYRNSVRSDPKSWKYRSEVIHLLAGEGCLSILQLVLKCINFGVKKTHSRNQRRYDSHKSTNTLEYLENVVAQVGIDIMEEFDRTPLRYASRKDRLDMVRFLVEQGANVNAVNIAGCTSLHCACQEGYSGIVEFLVQHDADVNIRSKNGFTALYAAVRAGHLDIARYLIEHGANVNVTSNNGFTILHIAATRGYIDIIRVLVQNGADVNARSKDGFTAVYAACKRGYLDVITFLLDSGAIINNNLLHVAVQSGRLDIVSLLVERGADVDIKGVNALHVAVQNGHLDVVRFLLERGLNVNLMNKHSFTALHLAAKKGDLEIVRTLTRSGADIKKRSGDGCAALHFAVQEGHLDTVKFLAGQAADVNARNDKGLTALHAAARKGHTDIVAHLVHRGAGVNDRSSDGLTALHLAAQGGYLDVVRCLVEGGAEVNVASNSGFTALHAAAKGGSLGVVRYLVDQGAHVNAGSSKGITLLGIAAERGLSHIIGLLRSCGADTEAANCDDFAEGKCWDVASLFAE